MSRPPSRRRDPTSDDRDGEGFTAVEERGRGAVVGRAGPMPYAGAPQGGQLQDPALYGIAAELVGGHPGQPGLLEPGGQPQEPRPAARLGAARNAPSAMLAPAVPQAAANGQPGVDPFNLVEAQRMRRQQQPGPSADGEIPYGLALELLQDQGPNAFLQPTPAPDPRANSHRGPRRALEPQLQGARLGPMLPGSATSGGPTPMQPPQLDPFTVMELAASQEGLPEPDYGVVAELRNRAPPDPFASDFGMAAEVARRRERSRSRSPLARGQGVLPPIRARRRLDPVDGDGFGIEHRQRPHDPFSSGYGDPFSLADEQLKIPRELLGPYEPSQQDYPGGEVPLRGDGGSEASGVSGDEREYGIAEELGVDPDTARRQREEEAARARFGLPGQAEPPEPTGHKYVYDEDTGMLISTEGGQGDGGRKARQYIEDEATGVFYKLHSRKRRFLSFLRRKEPGVMESDDEEDHGFRGRLRSTLTFIVNLFNFLGMAAQGLLGGFALLNFFMTFMLYNDLTLSGFLLYYAPISQNNARIYYCLVTLAVIASTARLAWDKLRDFQPRKLGLMVVDYSQVLLYVGAYICTVLCIPLDDELTYESNRNPRFYDLSFSTEFKSRLAVWNALNVVRTIFAGIAWLLTCYQVSPYVFEQTMKADIRRLARDQRAAMRAAATEAQLTGPPHNA